MKLETLQREVARAVMQPLARGERMRRTSLQGKSMQAVAKRIIKPNRRLTSFERLEIYNRQYWFRLLSSMMEDFPGLRAIVGAKQFEKLAEAYIIECPSRSFTLRNLGDRLESWLKKNPKWAGANQQLALDMVRLEWTEIDVFDSQSAPALQQEDLVAANGAEIALQVQPFVRLLELKYPVDDLLLEIRRSESEPEGVASNAFDQKRKHTVVKIKKQRPQQIFLAVHRNENSVYFRRLEVREFTLLKQLRAGKSLQKAIAAAFDRKSDDTEQQLQIVRQWFHNWAALGWFCRPGT
jgi:hypothetical protein